MKEYYRKALKKLTLLFLSNQISFNEQDHEKHKGPETRTHQVKKQVQINSLISDVLPDLVCSMYNVCIYIHIYIYIYIYIC